MSSEFIRPTSEVATARMLRLPERTRVAGSASTNDQILPAAELDQSMELRVREAVGNLNQFVQKLTRTLQFSVDEESGRTVIKVVDSETNQLIRQIPPEEVLVLARNLAKGEGVIFKEQV